MVYFHRLSATLVEKGSAFFSHLNWFDLIVIIIVMRSIYIGIRKGLFIEIFKMLSLGLGIFVAMTQSGRLGEWASGWSPLPLPEARILLFFLLFVGIYGGMAVIRFLLMRLITAEAPTLWQRIGGSILGLCRGWLWMIFLGASIVYFAPPSSYLFQSIQKESFFGPSLLSGGKGIYRFVQRMTTSSNLERFEEKLRKE